MFGVPQENYPDCGWTETHVQFARIGGFRLTNANGKTFLNCVRDRTIDLPKVSKHEIILAQHPEDLGGKTFAAFQTAGFVLQCIYRQSQHLLLTKLEVTTLAYALIYVFVNFFWWHKPYGVAVPIEVPYKERSLGGQSDKMGTKGDYLAAAEGSRPLIRLGIKTDQLSALGRIILGTIVGGSFGAMHCLAWNSESKLPTPLAEQYLWQASSLIVTVIGGTVLVVVIKAFDSFENKGTPGAVGSILFSVSIVMYCCARAILIILAALPCAV
ncbi:hypothetical protein M378DRAFT_11790 [Amanita muscaria Koide BX008]|uniref:Uncharacterized protein n=1 Tax=Amanita muscaria (strain Koide BX008) TaxID=946122 RepID=A0A0C2SLM9_AMAMK|nr:hypothetical protein M378DRAFT_11790 [Amanita muscaria Koide BX008]